jgi:dipeptidyl aminopeptidase/acylaminoacyl peptidase
MTRIASLLFYSLLIAAAAGAGAAAQERDTEDNPSDRIEALERRLSGATFTLDEVLKKVDDVLWFQRVGDVAEIDKVYLTGPPTVKGEETYGISNERHPFRFWCYVFLPKKLDKGRKYPLLVLPHGGVHADFTTYYTHIIRELMEQGYVVVAPEYRGSTGYGRAYWEAIDYGGREVGDAIAARDWAVEHLPVVDPDQVGILGWSHGGLISLMVAFDHPDKFKVAYAGVPVSDLLARMGYQTEEYREQFSAPYHIGKTAYEDVDEYRRRSPIWHVEKLKIPLLIHSNTNDRDVNVVEVEQLIRGLKAAGKNFEYRIYQDAPGGHSFNRMDTKVAKESRKEIYDFLAKYLKRK